MLLKCCNLALGWRGYMQQRACLKRSPKGERQAPWGQARGLPGQDIHCVKVLGGLHLSLASAEEHDARNRRRHHSAQAAVRTMEPAHGLQKAAVHRADTLNTLAYLLCLDYSDSSRALQQRLIGVSF